ncbi:MAG: hypothetical protein ABI688_03140 [Bacteroidota bacterium]
MSPIEKVYLHIDRDNYIAGESTWFKAYLYSEYLPDTISTSLYVEITNDAGMVVARSIVPVLLGTANGQINLADSLKTGSYNLRAYSPTMLNHDAGFIYKRSIFIYGQKNKMPEPAREKMLRLEFFPEGGNLVTGFANTLAFKATDERGMAAEIKGKIFNEKDEVVTLFNSYHDGMGMFELIPTGAEKYYALADGDIPGKKYWLPEQTNNGIAITVIPHPQGNFFELKQHSNDPALRVAYMIGQMQHHVVFKKEFKNSPEEMQGVINTQKLHSGILQITFFNKDDQPLAERLCFVNNHEYIQRGQLIADTINFSAKGRNRFHIQFKDTVQGSFSVSITDPEYNLVPEREENIFSVLLLTSDINGYVHNPAYYFSADNDSVKTALDLVMMTNGWRRFKWTELVKQTPATNAFKDPSFITLSGKVNLRDTRKPFAEKPLLLMLITADSTRRMQMINTDRQGNFRLDSMLFFGQSRILFSDIRGKKSQFIDVQFSGDSLTRSFTLPVPPKIPFATAITSNPRIEMDYDAILRATGVMLEGITVKTKKKNPVQELEEKYASGLFASDANKTIDLVNNKEAEPYQNIFEYLQSRVIGLQVLKDQDAESPGRAPGRPPPPLGEIDYQLYYRQGGSVSSMGSIPMTLYLDEVQTDASVITTIPANQVAMVKLFSSFAGATGNGAGGVLAIYTKKGTDMNDVMQHAADVTNYNGYTVIKEFYVPDYIIDKSARTKTDNRITLDWRPSILVNNLDPKIPLTFYNNDRTNSFKIVVEGMTVDGKMLLIEKTITHKGF